MKTHFLKLISTLTFMLTLIFIVGTSATIVTGLVAPEMAWAEADDGGSEKEKSPLEEMKEFYDEWCSDILFENDDGSFSCESLTDDSGTWCDNDGCVACDANENCYDFPFARIPGQKRASTVKALLSNASKGKPITSIALPPGSPMPMKTMTRPKSGKRMLRPQVKQPARIQSRKTGVVQPRTTQKRGQVQQKKIGASKPIQQGKPMPQGSGKPMPTLPKLPATSTN